MSLQYLVDDVLKMLDTINSGKSVEIADELYEELGKVCVDAIKRQMTPHAAPSSKGIVRMSNIGKPDRILYYEVNNPELKGDITPSNKIRFMYGDLIEALILFLIEASGNTVTNKQAKLSLTISDLDGNKTIVNGSCDGMIGDTVFDIKSASSYSFNSKFVPGGMEKDDPFGYRYQLAGYQAAISQQGIDTSDSSPCFIVLDKSTGELKVSAPSLPTTYEVKERLEHIVLMLEEDSPPPRCHDPIPKGLKGNMVLPKACGWCDFKFHCHQDANGGIGLRGFEYKTYKGPEVTYFTEVWDEPRVKEVT